MSTAFDIRDPERVAHQLQEANLTLGREPEAPGWMASMIRELSENIASATAEELEVAPEQWMGVQSAVLRAQSVLLDDIDERTQRRRLRLIIEELRFRLVRLAEQQVVDEDRPIKEIAAWFEDAVPVSHGEKGALFAVTGRTWERWASDQETTAPSGRSATTLRLLARLINELRYILTASGALRWAQTPLAGLDRRSPLDVFQSGDTEAIRRVFALVASARSGAAA